MRTSSPCKVSAVKKKKDQKKDNYKCHTGGTVPETFASAQ